MTPATPLTVQTPLITILMPVRNGRPFIGAAIRSLLRQTLTDFELLVLDDGSDDGTDDMVRAVRDPRIRIVRNEASVGVACTLNRGLDLARGRYVARMDADDISHPRRLEVQVGYLEQHPDVGVLGTSIRLFGRLRGVRRLPVGPDCVRASLLFSNPLAHPAVMMRRALFAKSGLRYDPAFTRCEDYELWVRTSTVCKLDNLAEPLLSLRVHDASIRQTHNQEMRQQTGALLAPLLGQLNFHLTDDKLSLHLAVGGSEPSRSQAELGHAERWLQQILTANRAAQAFTEDGLQKAVSLVWFRLCANSAPLGAWVWRHYVTSPLSYAWRPTWGERLRFFMGIVRQGPLMMRG